MPIAGENIGTAYVRVLASGRGFDDSVEDVVEDSEPTFKKGGEKSGERFGRSFNDAWLKKFETGLNTLQKKAGAKPLTLIRMDPLKKKELDAWIKGFGDGLTEITGKTETADTALGRYTQRLRAATKESDKFSVSVGNAFGKGGRNDFVNFVGVFMQGMNKIALRVTNLATSLLPDLTDKIGAGGFGGALAKVAQTIPGIIIILATLTTSFGLLITLGSGLLGILTALVGVLAFGLVGALGAAAGAMAPLIAGIGTVVLAFQNLSDSQKKALEPVGDAFGRLGDAAAESFGPALVRNADAFVNILEGMEPITRAVGEAMGRVLDGFVAALESPAMQRFQRVFARFLPDAVESLGTSFANMGIGAAGVFEALIPLTRRFLGWLKEITAEFALWSHTAEGQAALTEFFNKAGDAAAALGDLLGSAVEALFELFDAGQGAGLNILDSITGALDRFTAWAKTDEGQKALQDWFQFAQDLAGEIGDIFLAVVNFIDKVDTEENRKSLLLVLDVIEKIILALGFLMGVASQVLGFITSTLLFPFVNAFDEAEREVEGFLDGIRDKFARIKNVLGTVDIKDVFKIPPIAYISEKFQGAWKAITSAIGKVDIKDIFKIPGISYISSKFQGAWKQIKEALGKVDIKDIFDIPGISYISGKFQGAWKQIKEAIGKVDLKDIFDVPSLSTIAGWFSGLGGMIANEIGDVTVDIVPNFTGRLAGSMGRELGSWGSAAGALALGPQLHLIGEAGPEAIVPLARPLNQVDPAVRALSAIAQGLAPPPVPQTGMRPIELTVVTPTEDPFAVANEVVNRLVAVGY